MYRNIVVLRAPIVHWFWHIAVTSSQLNSSGQALGTTASMLLSLPWHNNNNNRLQHSIRSYEVNNNIK